MKTKTIDPYDLTFFLLQCDYEVITSLAKELGLPNSGSPYYDFNNIKVSDVVDALYKRIEVNKKDKDKIRGLINLLKNERTNR